MTKECIVVLSFTRMGDLVQSTPLLRSLRESHPDATISIIVLKQFAETARMLPMIDNVIEFDVDFIVANLDVRSTAGFAYERLQSFLDSKHLKRVDLLVNLSHTRQSATLSALLKPAQCIGMCRDDRGNLIINNEWINYLLSIMENRKLNPFNLVEIYNNLCQESSTHFELELLPSNRTIGKTRELLKCRGINPDRSYIVIHPGASHPSRCWHVERFGELVRRLSDLGYQIVVVGDNSEVQLAEQVVAISRGRAVSIAGETSVEILASLLKRSELLISNDTGTAHIAAAVNTTVLALFLGPASAKDTAPYGNGHIILEANLPCAPCDYQRQCSNPICKSMIDVDTVFRVAVGLLEAGQALTNISSNVRSSRTEVTRNGEFGLKQLSRGIRQEDNKLSFYRKFWNRLLNGNSTSLHCEDKIEIKGRSKLLAIYEQAEVNLSDLHTAMLNHDVGRIEESVKEQMKWQNELRECMLEYEDVEPFIRFLLVKCVTARTDSISEYYSDLADILNWFKRGIDLIPLYDTDKKRVTTTESELTLA